MLSMLKKRTLYILSLIMMMVLLSGCPENKRQVKKAPIRSVKVLVVKPEYSFRLREFPGMISANRVAKLRFPVAGFLEKINVNVGQSVKKGEILASLEKKNFIIALNQAKAEINNAQASLQAKKSAYEAKKKLLKRRMISKQEVDAAKADYEAAKSTFAIDKYRVEKAEKLYSDSDITAPFDGVISRKTYEAPTSVNAYDLIYEMHSNAIQEVHFQVPDTLISYLKKGMSAQVVVPILGMAPKKGTIDEIGSSAEVAYSYPVVVKLDKMQAHLRSGMSATVSIKIPYSKDNTLMVPFHAVLPSMKSSEGFVYILDRKTNRVKKRPIWTKHINETLIEVQKGLNEGETIVTSGVSFLHDGQQVKIYKAKE